MDAMMGCVVKLMMMMMLVCGAAWTHPELQKRVYGTLKDDQGKQAQVLLYTMKKGDFEVDVITYGSTLTAIRVPDRNGRVADVALGFDNLSGYTGEKNQYLGATVGRVANRINEGTFSLDGVTYNITKNLQNRHTLHAGLRGLDKKVWDSRVEGDALVMTTKSPDGEDGFPGDLQVEARYILLDNAKLRIDYTATTNKRTPVNIVNHVYLNLGGEASGSKGLYEHEVQINGDEYTELSEDWSIPTGKLLKVAGTPYDLTKPRNLGKAITDKGEGYDINYAVRGTALKQVALLSHPPTGRVLQVWSDQPGVQFYTSNFLIDVPGKGGVVYQKHGALCLETQAFPDAVNHPNFPSTILSPGMIYKHAIIFDFGFD